MNSVGHEVRCGSQPLPLNVCLCRRGVRREGDTLCSYHRRYCTCGKEVSHFATYQQLLCDPFPPCHPSHLPRTNPHTSHAHPHTSLTHLRCGRPVRLMLDRHEDMVSTGTRHPCLARYKVHSHSLQGALTHSLQGTLTHSLQGTLTHSLQGTITHYKVHSLPLPPSPPTGGLHQGGHPEGCTGGALHQQWLHAGPLHGRAAPSHVACGQCLLHPPLAGGREELQDQCPFQHCLQGLRGTPGHAGSRDLHQQSGRGEGGGGEVGKREEVESWKKTL